jgi:hypothetical protein
MDYLQDGKTGYLVQLNDLETFRTRCEELIQQTALKQAMAAYNTQLVENYFIDNCARQYESAIQVALEAARKTERETVSIHLPQAAGYINKTASSTKPINEKQADRQADAAPSNSWKEKRATSQKTTIANDEQFP